MSRAAWRRLAGSVPQSLDAPRARVGVECVGSRVQIANKALYTINVEDITRACKEKAGDGAAAGA